MYKILNKSDLCTYYDLNEQPGTARRIPVREDKFAFLDDKNIQQQLISFRDGEQTIVTFYLPQIHCSSCLYLLENLHKLDVAVISSRVDFPSKEVTIHFSGKTSLRKVAGLLTSIGYEPYISLHNLKKAKPRVSKHMIYQLGIAGFCFANIMLLSFPEYLGLNAGEGNLRSAFRILNVLLSLPVILYSAQPFYRSAFKGLKHSFLNIDAPIVLAIFVTFGRSMYEILSGTGPGYFDSMTGIVFFMLAGRVLQDKTYKQLSFDRDYTSYFPVAVTKLKENKEESVALPDIKAGDTLLIHNEELIPADGILTRGKAWIDYSFVTGESMPVLKEMGEMVYAGGKQTGGNIEVLVIKEVAQSYLTGLWASKDVAGDENKTRSFVHLLSRYFTYIVFAIALVTAVYWWQYDASKIWTAVTAILIIACPCALLLSNTFTNGNILRILGRNQFYLRNAGVIESVANTNFIVFDKTGTLTSAHGQNIFYQGVELGSFQRKALATLAAQSSHPLSRALEKLLRKDTLYNIEDFSETPGRGITGIVNGVIYTIGSEEFVTGKNTNANAITTNVYVGQNGVLLGCFMYSNQYRKNIDQLIAKLKGRYKLAVITGDAASERNNLHKLLGENATLLFYQKPEDKQQYIKGLQEKGYKVMMIGDGLNDACALKQSDTGIAVSDNNNSFTPSSDAIIDASRLTQLHKFIRVCKANKRIVWASFLLSVLYNLAGLFFAVQGTLSPLIAAILMPLSSLSILLITFGSSNILSKPLKL